MVLGGIFITNAVVAELIGVKIFSLERTFSLEPANINLFGNLFLDFNLTQVLSSGPSYLLPLILSMSILVKRV